MRVISKSPTALLLVALLAGTAPVSLAAQSQDPPEADLSTTVSGAPATRGAFGLSAGF